MSMFLVTEVPGPVTGVRVSPVFGDRAQVVLDARATEDMPGAVQSFAAECDINNIMRKFQRTGMLDWLSTHEGEYMDVTGVNFETAMDTILKAQAMFDDLPSSVRERFQHSPSVFFDFVHSEGAIDELRRLGLAPEPPAAVPVVPAPAT